jgi:hypothetical protein
MEIYLRTEITSHDNYLRCVLSNVTGKTNYLATALVCKKWRDILYQVFAYKIDHLELALKLRSIPSIIFLARKVGEWKSIDYILNFAIDEDDGEIFGVLLEEKLIDPANDRYSTFTRIIESGRTNVAEILFARTSVDPAMWNNYAIRTAVENGHYDLVKLLLTDPRVDPNPEGKTCLYLSCEHRFPAIGNLLLADPRVDPVVEGVTLTQGSIFLDTTIGRVLTTPLVEWRDGDNERDFATGSDFSRVDLSDTDDEFDDEIVDSGALADNAD